MLHITNKDNILEKIITLKDGLKVEVEQDENSVYEIGTRESINNSIEDIEDFIRKLSQPISNSFKNFSDDINIESAKISIGVKIGIEGGFILAKSTANAHIQIDLKLKKNIKND
mgnify:CR=1 FL=1